jgi:hypothetical protein
MSYSKKKLSYAEQIEKFSQELKEIKKAIKYSSFDTIYTSVLVLLIGLGFTIYSSKVILNNFLTGVLIASVICFSISLIIQILSLFIWERTLKITSALFLVISILAIIITLIGLPLPNKGFFYYLILVIVYALAIISLIAIGKFFNN